MPTTHAPQLAGHLLVDCLIAQGVTHAFGVPGESYLAVLDGFHARRDAIEFVVCRQEGGAAYMADAHARLSGRPGVCFVTRGPGATNASIGIHTAFQDSTPMVLFVGDVATDTRDREAFQEVDFAAFFGPSTKGMAKRVERIEGSHVFVVGDNPAASTDSRHYGAVTANDVLGRAMLRLPSRHSRLPQRL